MGEGHTTTSTRILADAVHTRGALTVIHHNQWLCSSAEPGWGRNPDRGTWWGVDLPDSDPHMSFSRAWLAVMLSKHLLNTLTK